MTTVTSLAQPTIAALFAALAFNVAPALALDVAKVAKDATLTCPANFTVKDNACAGDASAISKLSKAQCTGPGLAFVGMPGQEQCFVVADQVPSPTCSGGALPLVYDKSLTLCVAKDEVPRSSLTDTSGIATASGVCRPTRSSDCYPTTLTRFGFSGRRGRATRCSRSPGLTTRARSAARL